VTPIYDFDYIGILAASGCFWILSCLITALSIQRFIVKRYEKETDLSQTIYFSEFMPFAKHMTPFFSSPIYTGHLLTFVWGWKFVKFIKEKRKQINYYDDINSPEDITQHFSKKEIRRAKWCAISGILIIIHGIAWCVSKFIWPEMFD
jgi:hypothetical protein